MQYVTAAYADYQRAKADEWTAKRDALVVACIHAEIALQNAKDALIEWLAEHPEGGK